jgi:hypothetical protein
MFRGSVKSKDAAKRPGDMRMSQTVERDRLQLGLGVLVGESVRHMIGINISPSGVVKTNSGLPLISSCVAA